MSDLTAEEMREIARKAENPYDGTHPELDTTNHIHVIRFLRSALREIAGGKSEQENIEQQAKKDWLAWLEWYGTDKFLDSFLYNAEGAKSRCIYCGQDIFLDVLVGGGVASWSTEDGDYGCDGRRQSETCECCDNHMPEKRR